VIKYNETFDIAVARRLFHALMSDPKMFGVRAADGLTLAGYRWEPNGPARAVVQIAHGMSEHARRYDELAEALNERGYLVVAHDHRGHGASVPPGQEPGHMADEDGWNRAVADLHQVNRLIADEHPSLARVLLGHSMGSFMVQQLSYSHPGDAHAIALSASNGKPPPIALAGRAIARVERLRFGKHGRSELLDRLSFQDFNKKFRPTRTGFDWISRDDRVVDAYVNDPLCGFKVTTQTWIDMLDALPKLTLPENLARIPKDLPIYLFAGDCDPVGLMGKGMMSLLDSYRTAWLTQVEHKLYEGARHEILHETNRAEVIADLLRWMDRVVDRITYG
jgi:alpha-beta hydrolase superfamily lysophospholipase